MENNVDVTDENPPLGKSAKSDQEDADASSPAEPRPEWPQSENDQQHGKENASGSGRIAASALAQEKADVYAKAPDLKASLHDRAASEDEDLFDIISERYRFEDDTDRYASKRSRKRLQSNMRYLAETESRLSTIENHLDIGHKASPHKKEPKHKKAALNQLKSSKAASVYYEYAQKFDWSDSDKNSSDDPDPALSWAQLVSFYSHDLELRVSELAWDDFCQDEATSKCILEIPSEDWADWERRRSNIKHRSKQSHVVATGSERRAYDIRESESLPVGSQAVRINSKVAVSILREITQQPIPKGILLAPYKEFWFLEHAINNTLESIRNAAQNSTVDLSPIPFVIGEPGATLNTKDFDNASSVQRISHVCSQDEDKQKEGSRYDEEKREFSQSERFQRIKDKARNKAMLQELEPVVQYINAQIADEKSNFKTLKVNDGSKVRYGDLWKFYAPGTVVLSREDDNRQALRILHATGGHPVINPDHKPRHTRYNSGSGGEKEPSNLFVGEQKSHDFTNLIVDCYYLCFNGRKEKFEPVPKRFEIERFYGEQDISSLVVFPRKYARGDLAPKEVSEKEQMVSSSDVLVKRGQKYCGLIPSSRSEEGTPHRIYRGLTLDDPPEEV